MSRRSASRARDGPFRVSLLLSRRHSVSERTHNRVAGTGHGSRGPARRRIPRRPPEARNGPRLRPRPASVSRPGQSRHGADCKQGAAFPKPICIGAGGREARRSGRSGWTARCARHRDSPAGVAAGCLPKRPPRAGSRLRRGPARHCEGAASERSATCRARRAGSGPGCWQGRGNRGVFIWANIYHIYHNPCTSNSTKG